jgi:photosystem II stability/assembly factor-like uncharacterized protein
MNNSTLNKTKKIFINFIFAVFLLFFFLSFNFQDNVFNGWSLQFLPVGNQINDVKFVDSLTGFVVTNLSSNISYILKTTNAGNNWVINKTNTNPFTRIIFLNKNIGYCASWDTLFKTTNSGENWNSIPVGNFGFWILDMSILNEDTIWAVDNNDLVGGLFRTTNGGLNWIQQFYQFNNNPDKIYMVNKNLGFMSKDQAYTGRTTNGGFNWSITFEDSTFRDIVFVDSLIGYRSFVGVKKTTNGGLSWFSQILPTVIGSTFNAKAMLNISAVNKDTVYGVGGHFTYPNNQSRCVVYKTTNGGTNWGYQIPDTSFNIYQLRKIFFIDNLKGWAFRISAKGIYTAVGGDTTIITGVNSNNNPVVVNNYQLKQNYPNPFNSETKIKFEIPSSGFPIKTFGNDKVVLKVFDILGREVTTLVNEKLSAGSYEVTFNAGNFPSGIYFVCLYSNNNFIMSRKIVLLK